MIKNTILQQKSEKEGLLQKAYIVREQLAYAQKFLSSDLIKVITGSRRAGKSVFAILLLKDTQFGYINFDDENILKAGNTDVILKNLIEVYPSAKYFLFDEIQNLHGWELFVNKLQRRGYNIVLTGSNSRLLSSELASTLTGRYIPIELHTFGFREYLSAKNSLFEPDKQDLPDHKGRLLSLLNEYLSSGGYPEIVVKNADIMAYLDTLFDSIILKDIVRRHNIRFTGQMYDLISYLISNFSAEFTYTKLGKHLNFSSTNTVQKYVNYAEESYLLQTLNRFSFKAREQINSPKKLYVTDNGFITAKAFQFSKNTGKLMENIVMMELMRKGGVPNRDLFYYKAANGREVDFIVKKGAKISSCIQVCYNEESINVREREIKGLLHSAQELSCDNLQIITWDKEKQENAAGKTIQYIPLWKWLLERNGVIK